jgi:hypothetical protein
MELLYNYFSFDDVLLGKFFKRTLNSGNYLVWPDNNLNIHNTEPFLSCKPTFSIAISSSTFTLEGNINISGYYDFSHS